MCVCACVCNVCVHVCVVCVCVCVCVCVDEVHTCMCEERPVDHSTHNHIPRYAKPRRRTTRTDTLEHKCGSCSSFVCSVWRM